MSVSRKVFLCRPSPAYGGYLPELPILEILDIWSSRSYNNFCHRQSLSNVPSTIDPGIASDFWTRSLALPHGNAGSQGYRYPLCIVVLVFRPARAAVRDSQVGTGARHGS